MIPKSLYAAVARDILGIQSEEHINSFKKEANVQREEFLNTYGLSPKDFSKDPVSKRVIDERLNAALKQIDEFYSSQAKASGGLSPEMRNNRDVTIKDLQSRYLPAIQNKSIDRTMQVANENPGEFKQFRDLSNQSQQALRKQYGKETGIGLGSLVGAGLGVLGGRKLPKNTKGIAQQGIGGLAGAGIGSLLGGAIGSNRDEKKTGFNHEDILKPYEIADRIQKREDYLNG